ncbi:MAG: hypothetical protein U9Q82_13210 [Chloroflexota bacterium]|nr:hypothetical protein [Chloroflexota bacterium]
MPIKDCPFSVYAQFGDEPRPILPVRIINPHTGKRIQTIGIIDTGADECSIPADYAPLLGHDLQSGHIKQVYTGNGMTTAYSHTTRFEILHPASFDLLYTVDDIPVDFLPNLHIVLLGVNNFLSKFILNIDYPKHIFSILMKNFVPKD